MKNEKKHNAPWILVLAIIIVVAIITVGTYFLLYKPSLNGTYVPSENNTPAQGGNNSNSGGSLTPPALPS